MPSLTAKLCSVAAFARGVTTGTASVGGVCSLSTTSVGGDKTLLGREFEGRVPSLEVGLAGCARADSPVRSAATSAAIPEYNLEGTPRGLRLRKHATMRPLTAAQDR